MLVGEALKSPGCFELGIRDDVDEGRHAMVTNPLEERPHHCVVEHRPEKPVVPDDGIHAELVDTAVDFVKRLEPLQGTDRSSDRGEAIWCHALVAYDVVVD